MLPAVNSECLLQIILQILKSNYNIQILPNEPLVYVYSWSNAAPKIIEATGSCIQQYKSTKNSLPQLSKSKDVPHPGGSLYAEQWTFIDNEKLRPLDTRTLGDILLHAS